MVPAIEELLWIYVSEIAGTKEEDGMNRVLGHIFDILGFYLKFGNFII